VTGLEVFSTTVLCRPNRPPGESSAPSGFTSFVCALWRSSHHDRGSLLRALSTRYFGPLSTHAVHKRRIRRYRSLFHLYSTLVAHRGTTRATIAKWLFCVCLLQVDRWMGLLYADICSRIPLVGDLPTDVLFLACGSHCAFL